MRLGAVPDLRLRHLKKISERKRIMSYYNNNDDPGQKYHRKIDPFDKPWLQPMSLSEVDVKNDQQWNDWNNQTNALVDVVINKLKNRGGVVVSEDIRRDLHDFHGVNNAELANNAIMKVVADPRTIAFTDPNRKNSYYIRHNPDSE
jgi:hypothetical protein